MAPNVHDLVEHPPDAELHIGEGVEDDVVLELLGPVAFAQLVSRVSIPEGFSKVVDALPQRIEVAVRLGFPPGFE